MPPEDLCDCGQVGLHPYPIGGGWALACDDCKADSIMDAATGMPGEGANEATWAAWAEGAK